MARHLLKKRLMWGVVIAIGMVIAIVGSTLLSSLSAATTTTQPSYIVKDLGTLGGSTSVATAINNAGKVVGGSPISSGWTHAFLWDKNSIKDLNKLIPPKSGWVLEYARSINDKGQIVGQGKINDQYRAVLLTPVK